MKRRCVMAAKRATTKRTSGSDTLSITGLSAEAREAIAKEARKRRRSVNAWAANALEDAARRTLAGETADGGIDEVLALLKHISRKLDRLAARPSPLEKTLDQVQKSVYEMGGQLGTVYDEVRARAETVVDDVTGKAAEAVSQWSKAVRARKAKPSAAKARAKSRAKSRGGNKPKAKAKPRSH